MSYSNCLRHWRQREEKHAGASTALCFIPLLYKGIQGLSRSSSDDLFSTVSNSERLLPPVAYQN